MEVKFLDEGLKIQTKESLKELRQLLKPINYDRKSNPLGDLIDGKPSVYCVSGKDEDFSKIVVFATRRDSYMSNDIFLCSYTYPDGFKEKKIFDIIAIASEKNSNLVRNFLFKLAKVMESNDFYKVVREFSKLDAIWYQPVRYGFTKLHTSLGHLPKDYKAPY